MFQFPWVWAPRASVVYDLGVTAHRRSSRLLGPLLHPLRVDMANFTGGFATGAVTEEQVYVLGNW